MPGEIPAALAIAAPSWLSGPTGQTGSSFSRQPPQKRDHMKKRNFLKAIVLTGAMAMGLSVSQASAAEIKVGANIGNVPWEFQDASGNIVGFEIDLMKEVGKRLGMDVTFTNIPFQGLFAAVQSGQIDAAVSSITITKKRLESVSFAQPYYDSDQSLTVKADSGITGLAGMEGKIVGVDTGSTGDMWTTQNQAQTKIATINKYEGLAPAMLDLEAGRIDGYISDIPALLYYVKDKPQFKVVERIKTTEQYSVMFAKDSPLAPKVNDAISEMKKDGTLASIHEKWFGTKPDEGLATTTVLDMPKL
jgi:polar amino acid transport system substrate-binding protein